MAMNPQTLSSLARLLRALHRAEEELSALLVDAAGGAGECPLGGDPAPGAQLAPERLLARQKALGLSERDWARAARVSRNTIAKLSGATAGDVLLKSALALDAALARLEEPNAADGEQAPEKV